MDRFEHVFFTFFGVFFGILILLLIAGGAIGIHFLAKVW